MLLISMLISVFTGILLAFLIAKGHGAPDTAKYLWGLHRHEWGDIHTVFTMLMTGLMVLHTLLHLAFYRTGFRNYLRLGSVAAALAVLLITAATMFLSMQLVPKGKYDHAGKGHDVADRKATVPPH
jgi:zinc transporter ZupT